MEIQSELIYTWNGKIILEKNTTSKRGKIWSPRHVRTSQLPGVSELKAYLISGVYNLGKQNSAKS